MDWREFAGWVAFFKLHGFPDTRKEFYGAQLASLMLTVVSSKGKRYKTNDFLLDEMLGTTPEENERALIAHMDALIEKQNAS